ncbi:unnamed protein product [Caenorhabditis auriculariae]|uniref:CAS family C-terminal domain-containing protein n=1 Tax=Caenorhabditis auriculariae TaxID=2777116 RepID=A0A8S1HHL5_9PELO|nr:unnamed protein product [Caenorhabditis auriculariae]
MQIKKLWCHRGSGRVSPPFMESTPPPAPVRKYVSTQQLPTTTASAITTTFGADSPTSHHQHVSSSEEDEQRRQPPPAQQRTLVLPSSVPGRTIEIPLGGSMTLNGMPSQQRARQSERSWSTSEQPDWKSSERSPTEHQTQMEKLTQRLRNLAGKPFRSLGSPTNAENGKTFEPKKFAEDEPRTPSPSSSGICADITDQSSNEEKRTSDISSLSGGSDQNSSLSDNNEDSRVPIGRIAHQPYMARLTPQVPSTSFPPNSFENERPTEFRQTPYRPEERLDGSKRDWSAAMPKKRSRKTCVGIRRLTGIMSRRKSSRIDPLLLFPRSVGDILEDELQSRKRVVCNKLTESLRTIDQAMSLISKCTAAQHWRVPHILQGNLPSLREAVAAIDDSLENFIDTTGRISIDRSNIKYVELNRLLAPVSDAGWTVAVLSRDRDEMRVSPDNLEHFISIAKHVPTDCRRIVQWTQMLVPSNSVLFPESFFDVETSPHFEVQRTATTPTYEDKRLSTSSTSTIGAGTDASQPSSILVTQQNRAEKPQRGRVTFADEQTDRSSTGSSIENSSLEYSPIRKTPQPVVQTPILSQVVPESRIIEEDDLESVVSDRESLFQDYAYLDDVVPGRSNNSAKFIPEEDKQVIEFYLPQLDQHTDSLTNAVEEFLQTVEMNLPPREFIILAAHKLIYIGDSVSQCLHDVNCAERLRQAADRLCEYLKECVQATKVAADEHPDIGCMQAMVDSVMRVSTAAHDLKSGMRNMI